jgi:hypothetical protein
MIARAALRLGWFLFGASTLMLAWIVWRIVFPGPPAEAQGWGVGDWVGYNINSAIVGNGVFFLGGTLAAFAVNRLVRRASWKWGAGLAAAGYVLTMLSARGILRCNWWIV